MPMTDLKARFDRDGFVVVRNFLGRSELEQLRARLDHYIRDIVPTLSDRYAFYQDAARPETLKQLQNMGCDPFFEDYRNNERWCRLATELIGETCHGQDPEWFNKPPGTIHPTPPHQDNFYFCLRPAHVATLWLAIDSVDEENGCLRYVRGSHRAGTRNHSSTRILGFSQGIVDWNSDDEARETAVQLSPGDLVAHDGGTIHRADPNRSTKRSRRASER